MPPEEAPAPEAPQPAVESPSPAVEVSTETPQTESAPAPTEAVPSPETAQSPTPTAQIPPNEPLPPEPEPIEPEQYEPIQPPSAAAPVQTGILHAAREILVKARVAIQDRKRKKRDKILQALNTKNKITNDEVEKLLHVSDATATRYLSALEKEGKIRQVGKTGTGVVYSKI
ncbi:MAG: serine/threonine protein kinase [Parcubacteria group bacterium Gr01-1014_91]|nr:MAG: serine/threonine protein kinase [Parcubacteria group bacterium Gr01-1014_91]